MVLVILSIALHIERADQKVFDGGKLIIIGNTINEHVRTFSALI
jgi:hypothetical protein